MSFAASSEYNSIAQQLTSNIHHSQLIKSDKGIIVSDEKSRQLQANFDLALLELLTRNNEQKTFVKQDETFRERYFKIRTYIYSVIDSEINNLTSSDFKQELK